MPLCAFKVPSASSFANRSTHKVLWRFHTPKLIAGESESGAGVFTTDYFGTTACLAQSPQLYKQMAIASDLNRVFEVGPVFRPKIAHAATSCVNSPGLDLEMAIDDHYMETLEVIHNMFKHIFNGLETRFCQGNGSYS
jgi:aspartyl-tRNA synthetase